jgi:hypothetical protein
MVMAIRGRATGDGDQVSGLQAREGAAPVLLHFVVQDGFQSSLRESPPHIRHGLLAHIESGRQLRGTPSLRRFEQDASARDGARVGFASRHKGLQGVALFFGQGHDWGSGHGFPPFSASIPPPHKQPELTTSMRDEKGIQ